MKTALIVIFDVAASVAYAWFVVLQASRLPRVWRGESLPGLPISSGRAPEVNHRSLPVFVGFLVASEAVSR